MKYSKELHDYWRSQSKADFPETPSLGVVFYLLDEIERLHNQVTDYLAVNAELVEKYERLRSERRWIPVTERLPDDPNYPHTEPVLVLHGDYECTKGWYEKYDNPEECIFLTDNNHEIYDVTHWMSVPLPPAPESEGE